MAVSNKQLRFIPEGLTYDDVLLVPSYSEVMPRDVTVTSWFTKNIQINTPIVSAAMDTVTEHKMAIAIAQEGGIGVLHKNMSIAEQAEQVWSGLRQLKLLDRDTLIAFYIEGRSIQEMSDSFRSPVGTIKRRLHTARNRLKEVLGELQLV